jgi:hypothetical protein
MINTLDPVSKAINDAFMRVMDKAEQAADAVGYETINWLRSTTNMMQPGVKRGEGPRAAHPGGWADISTNLANAYWHKVHRFPTSIEVVFRNRLFDSYGKYLDAPTSGDDFTGERPKRALGGEYWVLSGISTESESPIVRDRFQELFLRAIR